ncbi:MAG: hypothetical protein JWM09_766 [Francisellaceae bacterium]|nr:hypothetical protein [Francisellaceae bacterium]
MIFSILSSDHLILLKNRLHTFEELQWRAWGYAIDEIIQKLNDLLNQSLNLYLPNPPSVLPFMYMVIHNFRIYINSNITEAKAIQQKISFRALDASEWDSLFKKINVTGLNFSSQPNEYDPFITFPKDNLTREERIKITAEKLSLINIGFFGNFMMIAPGAQLPNWSQFLADNILFCQNQTDEGLDTLTNNVDLLIELKNDLTQDRLLNRINQKIINHFQADIRKLLITASQEIEIIKQNDSSICNRVVPLITNAFRRLCQYTPQPSPLNLFEDIHSKLSTYVSKESRQLTFLANYYKEQPNSSYLLLSNNDGRKDIVKKIFSYL